MHSFFCHFFSKQRHLGAHGVTIPEAVGCFSAFIWTHLALAQDLVVPRFQSQRGSEVLIPRILSSMAVQAVELGCLSAWERKYKGFPPGPHPNDFLYKSDPGSFCLILFFFLGVVFLCFCLFVFNFVFSFGFSWLFLFSSGILPSLFSSLARVFAVYSCSSIWNQALRRQDCAQWMMQCALWDNSWFSLYMRKVRDMVENPHSGIPGKIFACSSISFIAVTAVSHCISTVPDVRGEEDWVNAAFLRVQCVLHCYPLREGDMQVHSINQADFVFGIQILWLP